MYINLINLWLLENEPIIYRGSVKFKILCHLIKLSTNEMAHDNPTFDIGSNCLQSSFCA